MGAPPGPARAGRAGAPAAPRRPCAAAGHSCLNRSVAALYRKYRPQTFDDVVGQEAVVRTLKNAITSGAVRQAYLFAGPRGTGKTSMARILAKSLNCAQAPTVTPDGTCHACRAIAAGTSLDVIEMDAASQRGIDDIREIRDRVVLQPVEGQYKVYILDEAHQLTDAAWNALLKLIEEPPPHLVFVFCTTDLSKVLPTVRSRCQTFVFQRPRLQDLVKVLRQIADAEGIDAPDQALALVARSGRGAYRDAVSTLDQLASATGNQVTVQAVLAVPADDRRRGGAPRLPLELALVKVTRPASDLSRESIAFRLERLEQGQVAGGPVPVSVTEPGPEGPGAEPEPERLEQGQAS